MECLHDYKKQENKKTFTPSHEFSYQVDTCLKCGVERWNNELQNQYVAWVGKLPRNVFEIQGIDLPEYVINFINERMQARAGLNASVVLRAMVAVYTFVVARDNELSNFVGEVFHKENLPTGTTSRKKLECSPDLYLEIASEAEMFGMSKHKYIAECCKHVTVFLMSESDKNCYRTNVESRFSEYLMVA
jgi:hypothetical protein